MYDVFLSCPYSSDDPAEVEYRVLHAEKAIVDLAENGVVAYSTIVTWPPLAKKYRLPFTYDFWRDHCIKMIDSAEKVIVLCIPGWEESIGVQDEIKIARKLGKEIVYHSPGV